MNQEHIPKQPIQDVQHSGKLDGAMREDVDTGAIPIEPGIQSPDTVHEGFENLPPKPHERIAFDQGRAAVRDSYETNSETPKSKKGLLITLGVGAAGVATAFGAWFGATGGGQINLPPKPVASAPANPGQPPVAEKPPVVVPPMIETSPAPQGEEIAQEAPRGELKFTLANGETATFDELSQEHKLVTADYKNGLEAMGGYLEKEMSGMIEYFPTAADVRNNLSYSDKKVLEKNDYLMAAAIHFKTYDIVYDVPVDGTNTIYTHMKKIASTAVSNRYDANGGDITKETVPFDATIDANSDMTQFTYSDNLFNTTPDAYGMTGKDPQVTTEQVPAYKIDHAIKLRAVN